MTCEHQIEPGPNYAAAAAHEHVRIKIFAVGRAGAAIAEELMRTGFDRNSFVVLHSRAALLAKSSAAEKIPLPAAPKRGVTPGRESAGLTPSTPWAEVVPRIKKFLETADVVFVLAGLGGRTGTETATLVAKAAKEAGVLVLGFVSLPFDCEGSSRQEKARAGLEALKATTDGVICLPSQKICKLIDENTVLLDAFKVVNQLLGDVLRGLSRMLASGGLIDIHLTDLCTLIGGRQNDSAFATAEAAGRNRSREAVEKLLAHPGLEGGQVLREAEAALVSVVGGPDLTFADVTRIMEQINQHCESAPVIMGAAIDESFTDRLAITLLTSRRAVSLRPAEEAEEPSSGKSGPAPGRMDSDFGSRLLSTSTTGRPRSRVVAPPPEMSQEGMQRLLGQQGGAAGSRRKGGPKFRQTQLPLEIVSKGRFDKCEPTIHRGEDLDLPTYVRRRVVLN